MTAVRSGSTPASGPRTHEDRTAPRAPQPPRRAGERTGARRPGAAGGPAARRLRRSLLHLVLGVVAALYLSPLLYMLTTSLKTRGEAGATEPRWTPDPFTLDAYRHVLGSTDSPVMQWFLNSLLAATAHAALVLATATPAAYALARMDFRGRGVIFAGVVATLFVPPVILLVPNFLIVNELAWVDTLPAIVVPAAAGAFGVFFLRQFFLTLPGELEEAAEIDGCNRWQIFVRVVLPLARPALVTLALLSFLTNWNDFLWPLYVLLSPESLTLPAGLANFQGANNIRYDLLMAGAVIASVPVLLLYVVAQRWVIEGVSRSGLKG
ncbi:carbohydrate ABC transporter permease [Streptomyces radiopugnans]|uniref:Multiple sugar transport system permease protein n=1 Tax=Streptomyces radiopugnans TaxID=403935 RepID=A0A1H9BP34_9ACTN|nr:carbohydrate ABC transporter permease [Streptomyces radiopugnans]SEP90665.1 multiple sugar transport system permease protein [Streptomyces radiopugnans]